jgi:hypothetical protein
MEIIKNKPLPRDGRGRGAPSKFDIADQLEVNDCLVVADLKEAYGVSYRLRRDGKKYTHRKLPEGGVGVWRTE